MPVAASRPASDARRLERRRADAEERVAALEAELARVEGRLADPGLYAAPDGVAAARGLAAERGRLQAALADAMADWEAAETAAAAAAGQGTSPAQ